MQRQSKKKEAKPFTCRISELKHAKESISKSKTVAVLAASGLGRTYLLNNICDNSNSFYIDLRKLSPTPESFSVEFIAALCKDSVQQPSIDYLSKLKLSKECNEIIATVKNELEKIKPDQQLLLDSAFRFAQSFKINDKKTIIAINNFEELLKLNSFSKISDSIGTFFSHADKAGCSYIISSSAVHLMKTALKQYKIDSINLKPLKLEAVHDLFESIAGKIDKRISTEVLNISAGLPIAIISIAQRFAKEKSEDVQQNISLIHHIFDSELVTKYSRLHSYSRNLFTDSLNRARGESLLKAILKVVSQNRPMRLTEIAHLIFRSGPVTKSLIERLVEVDMLVKTDNTFDFANPVLRRWCYFMFRSIEFEETPEETTLSKTGGPL
ncbi:hypothetical protein HQ545_02690 [Candidatus Woesearchaeota archaeon]|nr:hypothetical protein [Candidatus Woesearchaeota archaeon]